MLWGNAAPLLHQHDLRLAGLRVELEQVHVLVRQGAVLEGLEEGFGLGAGGDQVDDPAAVARAPFRRLQLDLAALQARLDLVGDEGPGDEGERLIALGEEAALL